MKLNRYEKTEENERVRVIIGDGGSLMDEELERKFFEIKFCQGNPNSPNFPRNGLKFRVNLWFSHLQQNRGSEPATPLQHLGRPLSQTALLQPFLAQPTIAPLQRTIDYLASRSQLSRLLAGRHTWSWRLQAICNPVGNFLFYLPLGHSMSDMLLHPKLCPQSN